MASLPRDSVYVTEIATFFPAQGSWTEEDYFALPETNRIVELSEGMLIVMTGATGKHQKAAGRLYQGIDQFAEQNQIGVAYIAPFDVRLWRDKIRQPDVLFVRKENVGRIKNDQYVDGAPDWVAEVISESTRKTDEVDKLAEYAQAGIPEYWLVDLEKRAIRVYALRGGAAYTLAGTYGAGEVARSETITGFKVAVDQVFSSI